MEGSHPRNECNIWNTVFPSKYPLSTGFLGKIFRFIAQCAAFYFFKEFHFPVEQRLACLLHMPEIQFRSPMMTLVFHHVYFYIIFNLKFLNPKRYFRIHTIHSRGSWNYENLVGTSCLFQIIYLGFHYKKLQKYVSNKMQMKCQKLLAVGTCSSQSP